MALGLDWHPKFAILLDDNYAPEVTPKQKELMSLYARGYSTTGAREKMTLTRDGINALRYQTMRSYKLEGNKDYDPTMFLAAAYVRNRYTLVTRRRRSEGT